MLKNLVKVANRLDSLGLTKEADAVDKFIRKMAGGHGDPGNWSESEWEEWESEAGTFPKMDASEEGMSLGNLGFSSLDSAGVDTDHVYAAIDEMRNPAGSYSMNNSSYLVVPHNYPKLEVMIYLNQPGRETRTYSGHRQRDLGDSISDFLVSNGYKSTELPVPGSEKLGY
jgi:hypothetical protein